VRRINSIITYQKKYGCCPKNRRPLLKTLELENWFIFKRGIKND